MSKVDTAWSSLAPGVSGASDLKMEMTTQELVDVIGRESYTVLSTIMSDTHDTILLRRCTEFGKVIKFHTDYSFKTLQVPLNGEHEYEGGRLVYATGRGLVRPQRPAGSYTLHRNDIAHGVTELKEGVRYGLFLLQKRAPSHHVSIPVGGEQW